MLRHLRSLLLAAVTAVSALTAVAQSSANFAVHLNGSNQYVTMGAAPALDVGSTGFTIECWFNRDGTGVTGSSGSGGVTAYPLVCKGAGEAENSNVDADYFFGIDANGHLVADFEAMAGVSGITAGQNYPITGTNTAIVNNQWYHAAVTYDGPTHTWKLYLNGALVTTSSTPPAGALPRYDSIQYFGLGTSQTSTGTRAGYFAGTIDEVRVWNYARSGTDIATGRDVTITSATGLVGRYGLDAGTGTTTANSIGDGTPVGTLGGSATWVAGAPALTANAAPSVALTSPASGASVNLPGAISLVAAASDSDGTVAKVEFFDNGTKLGEIVAAPFTFAWTTAQAGAHALTAIVTDNLGSATTSAALNLTVVAEPVGPGHSAIHLSGSNQYVTMGTAPTLDVGGAPGNGLTIECWFNRDGTGVTTSSGTGGVTAYPLVCKGAAEGDGSSIDADYFFGIDANGHLAADFEAMAGVSGITAGQNYPITGTNTPIVNNRWYHAAATYDDPSHTWTLYLDGVAVGTATAPAGAAPRYDSIRHFAIGASLTSKAAATGAFAGAIDEVRVWNRARSAADIFADRNIAITSSYGLVGRYALDEDTGTTTANTVNGGAPAGTLTNSPTWVAGVSLVSDATPTVSLTGLTDGSSVTPPASITLTATASDSDGSIAKVEFFDNGVKLGESTAAPYVYVWTISTTPGAHALTAVATDNQGIAGVSSTINVTIVQPVFGPGSSAVRLNGTNQYVKMSNSSALDVGSNGYTIECWFRKEGTGTLTSGSPTTTIPLVAKGVGENDGSNVDADYVLGLDNSGHLEGWFEGFAAVGGNAIGADYWVVGTNPPIVNDQWYHAAMTYDPATTSFKLYLNGALIGSTLKINTTTVSSFPAGVLPRYDNIQYLGVGTTLNSTAVTSGFFAGSIDEVRVWNYARSAEQVAATENAEVASADGLVARYGFNEATGTTTANSAGDSTTAGTFTNSPVWTDGPVFTSNTPPTVALTAPADGSSVTLPAAVNFAADASDSDGSIVKVEFYDGATKVGEATAAPYTFSWTGAAAGTHTLTANAIDNSGAVTASSAITVTVQANSNQPPVVTNDGANGTANNATGIGSSTTLALNIADPEHAGATVTFYGRKTTPATPGPDFSIATLPDTQFYSESYPATYDAQTQWLVDNRNSADMPNLAFVSHMGDVVNVADTAHAFEWVNADHSMKILEDPANSLRAYGIPWGVMPGNHDQDPNGSAGPGTTTTSYYNQWFPASRWAGRDYWGGSWSTTNNNNNYQIFSASGLDFIIINMEYDTRALSSYQAVLDWADALLKAYPDRRGIISTHWLINTGNPATFSAQGQNIYNALKNNKNLFLMLGGHVAGEGQRTDTFEGRTVYSFLEDYQGRSNGGDGWLRYYVFSPATNTVKAKTYRVASSVNPATGAYETDADSQFTFSYDMQTPLSDWVPIGTATVNPGDSSATLSWTGLEKDSNYEWYAVVSDGTNTVQTSTNRFATAAKVAPTVSLDTPADGASLSAGAVTLTATASDSDGTVAKVQFFHESSLIGETTTAPYSVVWTGITGGSYTLHAVAIDNDGKAALSNLVHVTVAGGAIVPPTVSLTAPADGATVTAGATVTLTASASDSDGTVAKVEFFQGSTKLGEAAASPYTFNWTNVAAGTYVLTAVATDNSGATTTSAAVNLTVNAPSGGGTTTNHALLLDGVDDYVTMGAAPALTVGGPPGNGYTIECWFYKNGTGKTATSGNGGVIAVPLVAKGVGEAENSNVDADYFFGIDANGHLVADFEAYPASGITAGQNYPVTGTNTAIVNGQWYHAAVTYDDPSHTWKLYLNGVQVGTATPPAGAMPRYDSIQHFGVGAALTSTGVVTGAFAGMIDEVRVWNYARSGADITASLNSVITSASGLVGRYGFDEGTGTTTANSVTNDGTPIGTLKNGATWTTNVPAIAVNVAPTVALATTPADGGSITLPATITLTATATDSDGTIAKVEFYDGATKLGEADAVPYTFTWTSPTGGSHVLTAVATDNAGASATSNASALTVSAPPNTPPAVSLTAPADGASYLAPSSVTLTANATDSDGTIAKVEFFDGATKVGEATAAPFTYTWWAGAPGSHALTAVATDNWGATATSTAVNVTVTAVPATVGHSALHFDGSNDYVTMGAAPALAVGGPPGNGYTIECWFYKDGTGKTASSGTGGVTAVPLVAKGVAEGDGSTIDADYFFGIDANGHLVADFEAMSGASGITAGQNYPVTDTHTPIVNGQWYHAAVTYDGPSHTWKLYLNGVQAGTATAPAGALPRYDSIQHFGVGAALNSTGVVTGAFAGAIDEVRVWNYARSGADIAASLSYEISSATGLVGRYGFNEDTGTTTANAVGSGGAPVGTLTNGPTWVGGPAFAANTPPTVALTAPADGASVISPAAISFAATASDSDSGDAIVRVEFYDGATKVGEAATAPYAYAWTGATVGTHTLTAVAYDQHGGVTTSAAVTVTVQPNPNQPPVVTNDDANGTANNATGIGTSTTIALNVADPEHGAATVTFYGRKAVPATPGPDFSIATLPDTQFYSESYPATYTAQTQWLIDNRNSADMPHLAFVSHMGDIVNVADSSHEFEWVNADAAMKIIENPAGALRAYGIPWGGAPGNHDQDPNGVAGPGTTTTTYFNQYFPYTRYVGRDYWGGRQSTLNSNNTYQLFSASGLDFIIVHMEYDLRDLSFYQPVIDWADALLKAYPDRRAIITTHWLVNTGNPATFSAQGQNIYNALKNNKNLFLMLGGHVAGEGQRSDTFEGRTIYSILQDYQGRANGGDGWLRYYVFSPANNRITAKTYRVSNPTNSAAGAYETDTDSAFVLPYDMHTPPGDWVQIGTANVAAGETSATLNWTGLEKDSTYEWYAVVNDGLNSVTTDTKRFATATSAAPTVSLDSPVDGATPVAGNLTLTASASAGSGQSIAKVEFFHESIKIGESTTAPYSFTWTGATAGSYALSAVATDDAGKFTLSNIVHVNVGAAANVPPTVALTAPGDGATLNAGTITLTATASDSDGTIAKVAFYNGSTKLGEDSVAPYAYNWPNVAAGSYTLTAVATDNLGASTTSTAVNVTVQPGGGDTGGGPSFSYTQNFDGLGTSTTLGTPDTGTEGWSFIGTLGGGHDTWTAATGIPASGAVSAATAGSVNNALMVNSAAATATAKSDANGYNLALAGSVSDRALGSSPTSGAGLILQLVLANTSGDGINAVNVGYDIRRFTTGATATPDDVPGYRLFYSLDDGATWTNVAALNPVFSGGTVNVPNTTGVTTVAPTAITLGSTWAAGANLRLRWIDDNDLANSPDPILGLDNVTLTATQFATVIGQPPTVSLTAPTEGTSVQAPASVTLTASATDSDGTIAKVEFYQGSTKLGEADSAPFTYAWTGVTAGTYALTAHAMDNDGNVALSDAVNITVTPAANVAPTVSLTAPADGATLAAGTITLNASAADSDGMIAKVEFYNGATKLGEDATAPYSFAWANVATGTYALTAVATDNSGTTATSSVVNITVTAVTGAPTFSYTQNFDGLGTGTTLGTAGTGTEGWSVVGTLGGGNGTWTDATGIPVTGAQSAATAGTVNNTLVANSDAANASGKFDNQGFNFALASSTTDRALGTSPTSGAGVILQLVLNNTSSAGINAFDLNYDIRRFTTTTSANSLPGYQVFYSLDDGATWTNLAALNPTVSGSGVQVPDTTGVTNVPSTTITLASTWAAGANLRLRWIDDNDVANSPDQIYGLDNVTLTATQFAIVIGQPPTVSLTSPTGGTTLTTPTDVILTASAADSDGTITKVAFYNGATKLGEVASAPYAFTWSNVAVGSYTLTAKATDNDGNVATSTSVSVTVSAPVGSSGTLQRGPYLNMAAPDSIVVRWRTSNATIGRVHYGLSSGNLDHSTDETVSRTDHEVRLTGLTSYTQYYYSVGSPVDTLTPEAADTSTSRPSTVPAVPLATDYTFRTSPVAGPSVATRIWVLGDPGTASSDQVAARNAYYTWTGSHTPDMILQLGDNAYNSGTDAEYQNAQFLMYPSMFRKVPQWLTLGNHDANGGSTNPTDNFPYFDMFTFPTQGEAGGVASGTEHYYSFNYGNIHFICLDSQASNTNTIEVNGSDGPMAAWLRQDLASTTATWIVAFFHHPPYTKGSHDSDSEGQLVTMRTNFNPILETGGVDLVLSGHSHAYERGALLDGHYGLSSTLTQAMRLNGGNGSTTGITTSSTGNIRRAVNSYAATANVNGAFIPADGAYIKPLTGPRDHFGAVYTVAGSSGQHDGGALNHPAMYITYDLVGSMNIDVSGTTLTATFVQSNGATPDNFTIVKQGAADSDGDGLPDAYEIANGLDRFSNSDVTADPDGDGLNNLLEYALGKNPHLADSTGAVALGQSSDGQHLTLTFPRIADPAFTYIVEGTNDLTANSWATVFTSTGADNTAGPVTVTDPELIASHPRRFLRLAVMAGSNSEVDDVARGYQTVSLATGTSSLGLPLVNEAAFAGKVASVSGSTVAFSGSPLNLGSLLASDASTPAYLEVTSGALEGERLDVDVAATIAAANNTVVLSSDTARNTLAVASYSGLAGNNLALRRHLTLAQIQGMFATPLAGNNIAALATTLQLYSDAGFIQYALKTNKTDWAASGITADQRYVPVAPGSGALVKLTTANALRQFGVVRGNKFRINLKAGSQFVANPWPVDYSPHGLGAYVDTGSPAEVRWSGNVIAALADTLQIYSTSGFIQYALGANGTAWKKSGDTTDYSGSAILKSDQAYLVKRQHANPAYSLPVPQ